MFINGVEAKHIVIRSGADGDDIIYIGAEEVINDSKNLMVHILDKNHNEIKHPQKMEKEPKRLIRIFRMDDISWYAAHSIMEFLNWYHKNIDSIECPDELQGMEMFAPEDGSMWSTENVTQEDLEKLGESDGVCRGGIGDLMRRDGEVFKMQTFADVLGDEDITEPFEIASTEF